MQTTDTLNMSFKINKEMLIYHLIYVLLIIGLYYFGLTKYLIFHTVVELFCVIVAYMIFIIAFNTLNININMDSGLIFLGLTYGFVGIFDILHLFSYEGIGLFGTSSANLSIQLWIVAGYMEAISFLLSILPFNKKLSVKSALIGYTLSCLLALLSIFYFNNFPDCFIEGQGLTNFKIVSEFIICGILSTTIYLRLKNKENKITLTTRLVIFGLLITIISKFFFISYVSLVDKQLIVGHLLKLISYYFIYRSLVRSSLKEPYNSLVKINNIFTDKNRDLENAILKIKFEYDLAEQRKAEILRKSGILNAILETSINGIAVIGHNDKVIHFNQRLVKILDLSINITNETTMGEIGYHLKDNLNNPDEMINNLKKLRTTQNIHTQLLYFKDGRIVEASTLPFVDEGISKGILTIFSDITDRLKVAELEENIQIKQTIIEKTKEYDELKDIFLSTVSHELRTPLTIILGTLQLVSKAHSNLDCSCYSKLSNYMNIMKQNCYRLIKLSNNLIDINKIDSGFLSIKIRNQDIISVIEDITFSVADYIKSKGITLIFDTNIEEKIMAFDSYLMERIMLNLLSNSVKFTEKGGEVQVNIVDCKEKIVIKVRDNGIGIPKDKVDIIFDRFRQVDSYLNRKSEGSGIGLALVKLIVEQHKGHISINTDLDNGTEFIIELPVYLVEDDIRDIYVAEKSNVERIDIEFSDIYDIK